jgi:hypothetical protein
MTRLATLLLAALCLLGALLALSCGSGSKSEPAASPAPANERRALSISPKSVWQRARSRKRSSNGFDRSCESGLSLLSGARLHESAAN